MDGRRLKFFGDHQSRGKMTNSIREQLTLLMLLAQLCSFANSKCQEAIDSVASVPFCPKSQEEWESAAKIKNCNITASQQACTNADEFVYHCVIDGFQNETLEVCAPRKLIHGFCAEFNVDGGVIQTQYLSSCNNATFPICNRPYQSTEAYHYQGCYELVYSKRRMYSTIPLMNTTSTPYIPENDFSPSPRRQ